MYQNQPVATETGKAPQQHCCRDTCQTSKQSGNSNSRPVELNPRGTPRQDTESAPGSNNSTLTKFGHDNVTLNYTSFTCGIMSVNTIVNTANTYVEIQRR